MSKSYLPQLFVGVVLLSGILAAQSSFALSYDPDVQLTASDGTVDDFFGHSVSISGDTAVVGAPGENALYVFDRNTVTDVWSQTKKITAGGSDQLGTTVGISGDTIVSSDVDTVYVFERNLGGANNWGSAKTLGVSSVTSVAISADTIAIGENSLRIWERNSGGANNWGEVASPPLASPASSVSISGDTALVGVVGSAFVHDRNQGGANNWGQVKVLSEAAAFFGQSVSISGDTAVVGGPTLTTNGIPYVYDRNQGGANNWGLVTSIPGGSGQSVSISGDTIISGSSFDDQVFAHDRNQGGSNNWGQVTTFNGPEVTAEAFGFSVYQSESNTIAIGAPFTLDITGSLTIIPVITSSLDADVIVLKTFSPSLVDVGQTTTITLKATNNGPVDAENVKVSDILPTGLSVSGTLPTGCTEPTSGTVTCDLGTITANGGMNSATFTVLVDVLFVGSSINNIGTVTTTTTESNSGNNSDEDTITVGPDVAIGGTYIPIDQSALLLAAVYSVSMWMIPVVIAGIGIGVFVIKRRK